MKLASRLKFIFLAITLLALGVPWSQISRGWLIAVAAPQRTNLPPPVQAAPPGGPTQPVYIYLYSRFTDHVNIKLEEARLRHILPMLEKLRQKYPETHVCATIMFSGAMSRALSADNHETGILNYVLDFARRGVIQIGYDGMDEPTYEKRPVVNVSDVRIPEDRWLARETVAKELLSEGRDPLTGAPEPGVSGGLKEMQAVFGRAVAINAMLSVPSPFGSRRGSAVTEAGLKSPPGAPPAPPPMSPVPEVGDDRELADQVRQYSPHAIMFGLLDARPAKLPGFRAAEAGFGHLLSPAPDTSPELYWQDGMLRSTEGSDSVVHLLHASDGVDGIKKALSRAARSRVRIIHVESGSEADYVQPAWTRQGHTPLEYAYEHPAHPQLPPEARRDAEAVDAAFAREAGALQWLATDFFPANPGSRFVSSTDLEQMTPPNAGFSLSTEELRSALSGMLKTWGNDTFPPSYLFAGGHYLSLADLFQVMTDAWAEFHRTGKFPSSVQVVGVHGPLRTLMGHGPNAGEVSVADIVAACPPIAERLHDDTEGAIPKNFIPSGITVGGININAAQFLRLMAAAIVSPSPAARFRVKMTYLFPGTAALIPKTRPMVDMGGSWTIKPAPLVTVASARGQGG